MGRPKKLTKPKEPVRIRERKLKGGSVSLYLDIYQNGKRVYEPLKLYIVPEKTPIDKDQNDNARAIAEKIKADRILMIQNHGIDNLAKAKRSAQSLTKWLCEYENEPGFSEATKNGRTSMHRKLDEYLRSIHREMVPIKDFDSDLCRGFINFLRAATSDGCKETAKPISKKTMHTYQAVLNGALNRAVRLGLMPANPMNALERKEKVEDPESDREFLTIEEVKALVATPCRNDQVKKAFLFGCFTGLRYSDIKALTWDNIKYAPDGKTRFIRIMMKKTKSYVNIPLTHDALSCMVEREGPDSPVFDLCPYTTMVIIIKDWVKEAGIRKRISFHNARHTFGTMMLTLGADIYTTSSLLGHANIATTQIYAKIIDEKKVSAVNLMDNLFM